MDSRKVNQTKKYLHGTSVEMPFSVPRITRYPLVYTTNPVPPINFARLPEHSSIEDMDLAYRQKHSPSQSMVAQKIFGGAFLLGILIPIIALFFPNFISLTYGFAGSAGIAVIILLSTVFRTGFQPAQVMRLLIIAPAAFFLLYVLGLLFQYRVIGASFLSIMTIVAFATTARMPFDYYMQWSYAHPRLRPLTRKGITHSKRRLNLVPLILALVAAALIPLASNSLAIAVVYVISIVFGIRSCKRSHFRQLRKVLGVYLGYRLNYRTPGLWFPRFLRPSAYRNENATQAPPRTTMFVLLFMLTMTLTTSLSFYSVWDFPEFHLDHLFYEPYLVTQSMSSVGWLEPVNTAIDNGREVFMWIFPVAIAIGLTLPIFLFMAIHSGLIKETIEIDKRLDGYTTPLNKYIPPIDDDDRTEWQWYIDRISQSNHVATDPFGNSVSESAHMFMGVEPNADFPVLLDRKALSEHCYIVGETGSGKTALGITPLLIQLLRGHRIPGDKATPSERPPIVILDLKGDRALFNTAREEAKAIAKKSGEDLNDIFRFFTPESGKPSYYFNPLDDFYSGDRSFQQLASLLLESLNLSHGEGYGRSYFTRRNRQLLYAALDKGRERGQAPQNIDELYEIIYELSKESEYKDASELVATLHSLSRYKLLSPTPEQRDYSIHMPDVLNKRQIIYFWLPSAIESTSVREIGKMAVYSILSAAIARQQQGLPLRQAYLFIDEFQQLAGENFKIILQQARSYGISNILANQSLLDLDTPDSDLRSTVQTNTRVKMFFSVTGAKDVNDLSKLSGEEIAILQSSSINSGGGSSESFKESLKPRLTTNDIMQISDHPLEYILQISRGIGYTQFGGVPIPVRCTWPLSIEEYTRRQETPWPTLEELGMRELAEEQQAPTEKDREAELERHRRLKMFEEVWRKRRGEAVPETV